MWTIIGIVVALILVKFFIDLNKQKSKIAKEGGMENKYRELIGSLLEANHRFRIQHRTSDSITVGASGPSGASGFILTQTFGKVTVVWKTKSAFGDHKMEWTFPEYGDQEAMAHRIINDAGQYAKNVMTAQGHDPDEY